MIQLKRLLELYISSNNWVYVDGQPIRVFNVGVVDHLGSPALVVLGGHLHGSILANHDNPNVISLNDRVNNPKIIIDLSNGKMYHFLNYLNSVMNLGLKESEFKALSKFNWTS